MKTNVRAICFNCQRETEVVEVKGAFEIGFTDDSQITDLEYDEEPAKGGKGFVMGVVAKTADNRS